MLRVSRSPEGTAAVAGGRAVTAVRLAQAALASTLAFLVAVWAARPFVGGDTPFVLDGTNAFVNCLRAGRLRACGAESELNYWGLTSPIGDWPLYQHVPDLAAVLLGVDSHPVRTRLLVVLGIAAVVGGVAAARPALARVGAAPWFWAFVVVVVTGPTIAYARSTAGEALALGLVTGLVAASLLRAPPPVVALAAFAASLTKETAYPFVAALGLLGLVLARRRTGEPIRRHVAWGAAGIVAAFLAASLFNVVRFGSILNTNYLQPELRTPGIVLKLEYLLAEWVSPNGGLLFFWPAATALLLAVCLGPLLAHRRRDVRPALVLGGVLLALMAGFAGWWTPFGWSGYGPRLILPWVPPLVLLGLAAYGDALAARARRLLAPWWSPVLAAVLALLVALPHVGYLWAPAEAGRIFEAQVPPCDAPWRGGVEQWHDCHRELLWSSHSALVDVTAGTETAGGVATTLVLGLGLLGAFVLLRHELARPSRRQAAAEGSAATRPPGRAAWDAG